MAVTVRSTGVGSVVGEAENPEKYEQMDIPGAVRVPRGTGHGGMGKPGAGHNPYGDDNYIELLEVGDNGFVPKGEWPLVDTLKFGSNDPAFLEKKAKEREQKRKEQKNKMDQPQNQQQGETPVEYTERNTQPEAEPVSPPEEPGSLNMFSSEMVTEEEGTPPDQVTVNKPSESTAEALIRTSVGDIDVKYIDIVDGENFVVCFYRRDEKVFEPKVAESDADSFLLVTSAGNFKLVHIGNNIDVPESELGFYIFHKLEE